MILPLVIDHFYLVTYIIGHFIHSIRLFDLVSNRTYVVCVNFIHKWRDLQFKVDSEREIFFRYFSWQFYLLSEFLAENAEEILFVFCFDVWLGARTLALRRISQHTTQTAVTSILLGTHNNEKQFICPLISSHYLTASWNNGPKNEKYNTMNRNELLSFYESIMGTTAATR